MNRTIEDYDIMARREMIKAKREKAEMYVYFELSLCLPGGILIVNC